MIFKAVYVFDCGGGIPYESLFYFAAISHRIGLIGFSVQFQLIERTEVLNDKYSGIWKAIKIHMNSIVIEEWQTIHIHLPQTFFNIRIS